MAEAAAISFATDAAKGIGQLLMDRAIEEMKMVWGLKDDLEKLKSKFSKLQLFLKDVQSAKDADKRRQVTDWLSRVKDAAYVADDIMDDYEYEIIRRECEQKNQCLIQFQGLFSRNNNPILFRIRMSNRVRDALASFDELDKDARDMGLKHLQITAEGIAGTSANNDQGSSDRLSQARQDASAGATEFVGREDEIKKLLQIMCSPSNQEAHIATVAILGLGGLGKTTFARCLYDSKDIDDHFDKKLWISVSDNFTILRILNQMLQYVPSNNGNLSNIDAIINKLQENLKNKKYLLVLDDVWCKDQDFWSSLKNTLQRIKGLPGCLILITTRLNEVTTGSQAVYTHSLRDLSEEEGWVLLKQRVSLGETPPNFLILEEIGKRIVAKCKGVPLAIKAIGGILQSKQLPCEWELIEKSEIWDLPQNDENQILPSLRLTFDHLPSPSMKQCFAYCAAFCPRGSRMEKDELVDIWLAQGFLHQSETKHLTMEEIGEEYLMVLRNYSLLNEVKGEIMRYNMHDLVYDLAMDVCGKDLLCWKPEDHWKIDNCRHLVVRTQNVEALSQLPITKTLGKLRTLSVERLPRNVLAQAEYLRTLSVDGCEIKELPSSIGLLKHLRYLSLSYNPIKTLPDSIGKLYLLQTLRLLGCHSMEVLPKVLYRLTNIIHIPTTTPMLATRGLLELSSLHTLPRLALRDDEDGWTIDELGALQNLMGEIHISGLEHVKTKENARKADLAGKAKVSNITLAWAEEREEINDEDVLDGLQPHPNIISLELQNFFGLTLPSWMVRMAVVSEGGSSPSPLKNLTSFKLLNCSRCKMLPTLGHLPCLKYLVLSGLKVESIGKDFYSVPLNQSNNKVNRVSFPSLTKLEISEFESLKTWVLPSTGEETIVFPRLDVIKLRNCPELETIPALDFPSLKKVKLYNVGIQSLDITKHKTSSMLSPEVNLKLETLEIINCKKLVSLPSELQYITSLKTMKLSNCHALTSLPNNIPTNLEKRTSLATFTIEGLTPDFSNSSVNHVSFPSLTELKISNCGALKTCVVPPSADSTNVFPRLEVLRVTNCPELETIPALDYFQSLKKLQLSKVGIQSLDITKHKTSSMLSSEVNLKLETLEIYNCEQLLSLPSELQYITSLKTMKLTKCPALTSLPNNIPTNLEKRTSLATFTIEGRSPDFSNSSVKTVNHVSFPSLIELEIYRCGALKTCLLPPSADSTNVFPRLEVLRVTNCPELETIPALDYFQSLKKLQLSKVGIQSLDITKHKTSSMLSSEVNLKLETLEIYNCEQLLSLPSELQYITSLKTMKLTKCPALTSLPNNIPTNLEKRTSLATFTIEGRSPDFSNSSVKTVNHVSFPSLIELEIYRCGALKTCLLPPSADSTNVFPRLEVLRVTNCPELETLPTLNFQSLKKVKIYNLGIRSFSIASPNVNMMLETLEIFKCEKLVSVPWELQFVASLKTMKVNDCPALTSLPNDLFQVPVSLSRLHICRCKALSNIPTSLEKCVSLATITIEGCPSIKGPMLDFSKLKSLQHMSILGNSIELMISMLKAVEHLPNLMELAIGEFKDEVEQEMYFSDVTPIQRSQSLTKLRLDGNPNIKSLPEQLQLLTQITHLTLENFDDLEELPEWVGRLSSLEELYLYNCKKLKDIPSKEVFLQMTRLRRLTIDECPILAESCVKDVGSDWSKISHIPSIRIWREFCSDLYYT